MAVAGAQGLSPPAAPSGQGAGAASELERPPSEGATPRDPSDLREKIAELSALARAAEGDGDAETAVNRLQKAALLAQSLGDQPLVGELLVDAAQVFTLIGEYRQASRFLDRAREIAAEAESDELKGEVYRGFGLLYKARGNLREAAVCFDRALEKLEFSSRHRSLVRVLLDLGEVYLREGRTAQAAHVLDRATLLPARADPALTVRLHLNLGRLAYLSGDRERAVSEYEAAADAAEGADRSFERELVALGLAGLHSDGGRLEEALQRLREALALSIVAFAREPIRGIERARFIAMGQRLLELETAVNRSAPPRALRRAVDETVSLYNAHPLVLTGASPRYGSVAAVLAEGPGAPAAAGNELQSPHPNPK